MSERELVPLFSLEKDPDHENQTARNIINKKALKEEIEEREKRNGYVFFEFWYKAYLLHDLKKRLHHSRYPFRQDPLDPQNFYRLLWGEPFTFRTGLRVWIHDFDKSVLFTRGWFNTMSFEMERGSSFKTEVHTYHGTNVTLDEFQRGYSGLCELLEKYQGHELEHLTQKVSMIEAFSLGGKA